MKRISIIIPVYNAEKYIARCINSIINQLDKELDEIICVNDGSTDDSLKILKRYEKRYEFIRVIDKKNEGIAATRNLGLKEAQGEFVCFIDNDDYIDSDYIRSYYSAIIRTDADIVIGGYRRVDQNKRVLNKQAGVDSIWFRYMIITPWAKMYRRSFLVQNDILFFEYPIGEDIYFNIKAYSKTNKISVIEYIGYNWYYNNSSVSNTVHKGFDERISIRVLLNKLFQDTDRSSVMNLYYTKFIIFYLLYSGRTASPSEFIKQYKSCFNWMRKREIPVSFPVLNKEISGEPVKNRLIIKAFIGIYRLGLMKLFAKLYCTG